MQTRTQRLLGNPALWYIGFAGSIALGWLILTQIGVSTSVSSIKLMPELTWQWSFSITRWVDCIIGILFTSFLTYNSRLILEKDEMATPAQFLKAYSDFLTYLCILFIMSFLFAWLLGLFSILIMTLVTIISSSQDNKPALLIGIGMGSSLVFGLLYGICFLVFVAIVFFVMEIINKLRK